jgi:hypothetical protein
MEDQMEAKTFAKRFNAQRAARAALKNSKAVEGVDFQTVKIGAEWHIMTIEKPKPAAAKATAPKAAKPAKAKALGQRAQAEAAAAAGKLPSPPDFSAETHARFRKRLAEIVGHAEAGDIKALRADTTEPKSSSRAAICRYRDLAIVALEARAAGKAAA